MSTEVQSTLAPAMSPKVEKALRKAADATGVSFEYLMKTANNESGMNPNAQAKTSSARGLFQFIESTWMHLVQGLDGVAGGGDTSGLSQKQLLKMRDDPDASAMMAAVFTQKNADNLKKSLGRDASYGELYMAHFLGAGGASKLIDAAQNKPETIAARIFPDAAKANKAIFFHKGGQPRTVGEVYDVLAAKGEPLGVQFVAQARGVAPLAASNAGDVIFEENFVDTSKLGSRFKVSPDAQNITHSLFQTKGGVRAKVASLWGDSNFTTALQNSATVQAVDAQSASGPLSLKNFLKPAHRSGV